MPTPEQVREDMLSFYDWGADGVMAFIYHWEGKNKEPQGLDAFPEVRDMVGRTNQEILAGKINRTVPPVGKREWLTILTGAEAKPSPGGQPAYNLDDPARLASLVKGRPNRFSAAPFAVEGRSYPLKVSLPAWNRADPKSDRWPIAQFAARDSDNHGLVAGGRPRAADLQLGRAEHHAPHRPGGHCQGLVAALRRASAARAHAATRADGRGAAEH